jgi:chromosome segregation protein
MRLKSIKLAGFKSFVDPTTVIFPANLTAIVGPNGCGKSNVIDAVRWVMGESSAKQLRGEALTDVIFNGSGTRKPTAQASIELLFDNSDRRITGEYAGFAEIAIRRQVTRDGQSAYFLNGTRCRRRDITDIFLGTGLGPRSYSIIEQGMISGLVEARPEELRSHLEEAAGISKYKERRRETENRMRHTRENIERLDDLRGELETQLRRLDRQARAAERYRTLQGEELTCRQELLALRLRTLAGAVAALDERIGTQQVRVEEAVAELRRLESRIEAGRTEQTARQEAVNEANGRAYALGAEVARLEDALKLRRQRLQAVRDERAGLEARQEALAEELAQDEKAVAELSEEQARIRPDLDAARARAVAADSAAKTASAALSGWQERWEALLQALREPERLEQVESTRVGQLELQLERLSERRARLGDGHGEAISARRLALSEARSALEATESQQQSLESEAAAAAEAVQGARTDLDARRRDQAAAQRRLDALEAQRTGLDRLQQEALGNSESAARWLEDKGLADRPRLVTVLDVQDGWQRAVEGTLGPQLGATCVDDLDVAAAEASACEGLFLVETGSAADGGPDALAAKVGDRFGLGDLLAGIRTATDVRDALARRRGLGAGQRFVTPEGIQVGRNWLAAPARESDGMIARQAALSRLQDDSAEARAGLAAAEADLEAAVTRLTGAEAVRDRLAEALRSHGTAMADARGQVQRLETELGGLERQEQARIEELRELERQHAAESAEKASAVSRIEAALAELERHRAVQQDMATEREALAREASEAEAAGRLEREAEMSLALRERQVSTQLESLALARTRLSEQRRELSARLDALAREAEAGEGPIAEMQAELETVLKQRREAEQALTETRQLQGRVDEQLRSLIAEREQAQRSVDERREGLERLRLERQSEDTRRAGVLEQLAEAQVEDPAQVLEGLPEDAREADWVERLEGIARRIQRLGPINLAAIDEYEQESERKAYLDAQHDDLTSALETLETAIRKIDRETRTRFSATFETVNNGLKELFPKVFGGGEAYLELTGDDLLTTGVSIMARPPGKRNASIHLLSGGEKAMVAVALVLAIFRLNPAPFCMLDEVDAPLDDANVFRFADLLRGMSDEIQFIYITHNKVSMEMASHLMGVTMQEAGVSRIVSVNVEEAAAMAAG